MAIELKDIAKYLTKTEEDPLKVRIDADASLVVIAHNGMKFRFSGDQIAKAEQALKPKQKAPASKKDEEKPKPVAKAKPASKPDPKT